MQIRTLKEEEGSEWNCIDSFLLMFWTKQSFLNIKNREIVKNTYV